MRQIRIMQNTKNLGDFIEQEMSQRGMSARQFAEYVGVSSGTISHQIDSRLDKRPTPTVDFLLKLADATQTDLAALLALAYPEVMSRGGLSADLRYNEVGLSKTCSNAAGVEKRQPRFGRPDGQESGGTTEQPI